ADNLAKLPDLSRRSARFECKIFTEPVAVLLQLFQEDHAKWCLLVKRRSWKERADAVDLRGGLSGSKVGPGNHRTGEKGYEVATEHDSLSKTANRLTRNVYHYTTATQESPARLSYARDKLASGTFGNY